MTLCAIGAVPSYARATGATTHNAPTSAHRIPAAIDSVPRRLAGKTPMLGEPCLPERSQISHQLLPQRLMIWIGDFAALAVHPWAYTSLDSAKKLPKS